MSVHTTYATAWGESHMFIFKALTDGTFPDGEEMYDLGELEESSINISVEDGTTYQLYATGHRLLDELKGDSTLKISATLIKVPRETRDKFWDTEEVTVDGVKKQRVKSLANSQKWAVRFASKVIGSETFDAPYCSVSLKPLYEEDKGYKCEVEFTIMQSAANILFEFGEVRGSAPDNG